MLVKPGDYLNQGEIFAEVKETESVNHKIMIPPGIKGEVIEAAEDGPYNIEKTIVKVRDEKKIHNLTIIQEWPVREPRPYYRRLPLIYPYYRQRVICFLWQRRNGSIPGGFGTGKTYPASACKMG